jgi:DNA polymerase-3 subunit gamma/tau
VRRVWDQVLDAVARRKRTTRALLDNAQVTALTGSELTVTFKTSPLARQFDKGVNFEVLHDALAEVLGVDWTLRVEFGDGEAAPPDRAPGVRDVDVRDDHVRDQGIDPTDEAVPAPPSGDDAAVSYLRSALGASVISADTD